MNKTVILAPLLTVLLAGCSGTPPELSVEEKFSNRITRSVKMDDQLSGFSRTAWDEVPDSGTASVSGYATLVVDTAPAVSLLIGNANININFDNPGVIGSLTNFVGSDSSGNLEEYDGTIAVTSGTLARFRDNDFYAIYGGSLAAPGDSIIISGELEGEFVRTPLQGIQAKDTGVVASHNGTSTLADLKVVGQLQ